MKRMTGSGNVTVSKRTGVKHSARLNRRRYSELLSETLPSVIRDEKEYDRIIEIVDRLAVKERTSPEEERLLDLLSTLVEVYENEKYPIPDAPPHVMIREFMIDRGLRQADLIPVLGSRSLVSEIVNGKRKPSKVQIRSLGEFFGVSPELFLSLD